MDTESSELTDFVVNAAVQGLLSAELDNMELYNSKMEAEKARQNGYVDLKINQSVPLMPPISDKMILIESCVNNLVDIEEEHLRDKLEQLEMEGLRSLVCSQGGAFKKLLETLRKYRNLEGELRKLQYEYRECSKIIEVQRAQIHLLRGLEKKDFKLLSQTNFEGRVDEMDKMWETVYAFESEGHPYFHCLNWNQVTYVNTKI